MGRSIIEQVEEEKAQKAKDQTRRMELRGKMDLWRSRGYIIARLLRSIDGDLRQAEQVFSDFDRDVRRLSELQLRLNGLDVMGFPEDVLAIRQGLNDPDAVDGLEKRAAELEGNIKARADQQQRQAAERAKLEKEKMMGQYRQRIAAWAQRGYSTRRLEGLLEDPAAETITIEKRLGDFDADIQKLLEQGRRLEAVRGAATAEELKSLEGLMLDPDAVNELDAKFDELEQRDFLKRSDRDKRARLSGRVEEYRQKGYKVARLEPIAEMPLDRAEEAMRAYEADVGSMFKLWDRLRAVNRGVFPLDWDATRALMNDPGMVTDVERRVGQLETRQKAMAEQDARQAVQLASAGKALIAEINEKMRSSVPDYNPQGFFMEDAKWDPVLAPDRLSVRAETRQGLLGKETVAVSCQLTGTLPPQTFMAEAERARASGRFAAMCYLMTQPAAELMQLASGFGHPNLSVYILDLGQGKLHFNEADVKTRAFAGWFIRGQRAPVMKDAVKIIADKYGIFTRAALEQRLGLRKSDIDRMLKGWLAKNQVVVVSKIKDEYSFMD